MITATKSLVALILMTVRSAFTDVTDTMRLQHDSLLRSTGRVVEIHEDLEIHKQRYKQYHELLYGQVVDPLNERSNRPLSDFQEYLQPLPSTS